MVRRDMPIEEFAKTLTIIVGGEIIESKQVNGVTAMCITKDCDSSLRPMVHVKPLYDDYINDKITMADAASYILRIFEAQAPIYDTDIYDYSKIRRKIVARLYNQINDFDISVSAKDYGFDDLILVPYIENVIKNGSIRVDSKFLSLWCVTKDELMENAFNNIECEIANMFDILRNRIPEESLTDIPRFSMYVISNHDKCFGANAILKAYDALKKIFPKGYIVLPSSLHEVIAVELIEWDEYKDYLTEIVNDVNKKELNRKDWLSDKLYSFK